MIDNAGIWFSVDNSIGNNSLAVRLKFMGVTMTKLLFLEDSYLKEFTAKVIEVNIDNNTSEIGTIIITGYKSKGRINKRMKIQIV
jgi:hypothetical protein